MASRPKKLLGAIHILITQYCMKSPRCLPKKQASKKRQQLPKIWNGLVYADLLAKFTRDIEKLAHDDARDAKELGNARTKKSQLKLAFDSGRQLIRDLSIRNPDIQKAVYRIEGKAKAFASAHEANIRQLEKLLPRADDGAQMSWPPPVPAHLAINSFVSLSLRIHTERPMLAADKVMLEAARTTLLPVLAHWICISGKSGMPNMPALQALGHAFGGDILPGDSNADEKWLRVTKALAKSSRSAFGKDSKKLFEEIALLVDDYRQNPHGGRLWQQMGKLNGTPPGSNLLTVFECIHRLEPKVPSLNATEQGGSTYYCSRLRYEAVRLGHYNEEFKRIAGGDLKGTDEALAAAADLKPREKLSMAFILSRHALISPGEPSNGDRKTRLANHTIALLSAVADNTHADKKAREVADRYLLGFMTNPRFEKPFTTTVSLSKRLEDYKERHRGDPDSIPHLLSQVFEARLAWARALGGEVIPGGPDRVIELYARACETLLSSIEEGSRSVAFDSEAPIWILPEMSALVWMGDKFHDRTEVKKRLSDQSGNRRQKSMPKSGERFENASAILARIAETEFGIYYHQVFERARILDGMVRFSEIAQATRQR